MNASIRSLSARSAAAKARSTPATDRENGFSTSTCFPASSDWIDPSTWSPFGVEM